MKKILPLLFLLLACSSAIGDLARPTVTDSYGLDFRKYTAQGFLFTPEPPNTEYESMGLIEVSVKPEIIRVNVNIYNENKESVYLFEGKSYSMLRVGNTDGYDYYGVEVLDLYSAIDSIFEQASEWGANAIYNFEVSRINEVLVQGVSGKSVTGFTAKGFAVKTK